MTERRFYSFDSNSNGRNANPLFGILVGMVILIGLFFVARFIVRILYILAPIFLIIAAIVDHKVIVNFAKWLVSTIKKSPPLGIGVAIASAIGYPFLFLILMGRALFNKRVKDANSAFERYTKGEEVEFEELDSEPLELPELDEEISSRKRSNDYDDVF